MAKKIKYDGQEVITKYAECDSVGNKISTTYAKKTDVPSTNDLVKTTGAQNIAGVKTFTDWPQVKSTIGDAYINFNSDWYSGLCFRGSNGGTSGQPDAEITYDGDSGNILIRASYGVNVIGGIFEASSHIPYRKGYKYSGYFSSTSTASNKYYVCLQFFDDKPGQSYISGRGQNITTLAKLIEALYRAGHTSSDSACPASGKYGTNNVVSVYSNGTTLYIQYVPYSSGTNTPTSLGFSKDVGSIGTVSFTAINS